MEFTPTFKKMKDAWMQHPRYIDSAGGTRSGKTFAALQAHLAATDEFCKRLSKPRVITFHEETL